MRVLVTGSSGKVGRAAVAALKAAGHRVTCCDLSPVDGHRTVRIDCRDFGDVMGAVSGIDAKSGRPDAIVHLAGIPAPGLASDAATFDANVSMTYNVFSAAARLGIRRVVWASSETILGLPFDVPPPFAPLDETTPDRPSWSYALAKQLGEAMADSFVRWTADLTIVSLRFSNVFTADDYASVAAIQATPDSRRFNLWGYVDADDCGEACRLAVEAPLSGHERFVIAAADNIAGRPSRELMSAYFPDVPLRSDLDGDASLLSSRRAAELLGYRPRHSWKTRCAA
jgi:nucleoside-diphosphate-sugar epimerase